MIAAQETFVCLEERRSKRPLIGRILSQLGEPLWLNMPPLGWRAYAETSQRASEAYLRGTDPASDGVKRSLKLKLLAWQYNGARRYFETHPRHIAVAWNATAGPRYVFMQAAKDAGAKCLFLELGPFRGTLTADPKGVNFLNGLPRAIDPYVKWSQDTPADEGVKSWRQIGQEITQRAAHKPRAKADINPPPNPLAEGPFLFAPLQYPGDSQLRIFGGAYRTVTQFVEGLIAASSALPEGWHIRIKEHPSAPQTATDGLTRLCAGTRVILDNTTDTFAQVRAAQAVVTVNSSVGLEAMLLEKPVIACGECFWAIETIAHHAADTEALATHFKHPQTLTFSAENRDVYLRFLTQTYYPRVNDPTVSDQAFAAECAKIADRLSSASISPIWAPVSGVTV
ncbi:capsular biosynthesis protein [Albirhodobacter sp. R86504]|uniref:capsular polysaccharide export protein, LipB/KpsS family n=1 Tax=Albirhodobacter sp. R86504 TaxID=3093848 RepID=UPI0036724EAE